ncbi:MAG: acyltransferase [Ruminococcus sp.]|nr:acyltransferase [Ruminococcus sp.]
MNSNGHINYIDNIRWGTVLLVIFYHVFYTFNTVGVITNIDVKGIPAFDAPLYFIYPWFMCLLFVTAGMSANYALRKRSGREFMKNRAVRLLVPSVAGVFATGWINSLITLQYTDMFGIMGDELPAFAKYIIMCMMGIGPLWFAHQLFAACAVLMLVRKLDKKDKLGELGKKANIIVLLLMFFPVWGSAQLFNMPMIEVYRNGIYIFMFLLGYYVFAHENVTDALVKYKIPLLIAAVVTGIAYTAYYFGQNYASHEILDGAFTNFYCNIAVLAAIGCCKAWANGCNGFTRYMNERNFGFYVLHYPLMQFIAYAVTTYLHMPMQLNYIAVLVLEILLLPIFYEIVVRIPVLRFLLLGVRGRKKPQTENK